MPTFTYVALMPTGARVRDQAVADSEDDLRAQLASRGLLVRHVRPTSGLRRRTSAVAPEQFAFFNQEMMALLRAGLTIPDALALAANRPDCPALGQVLTRVQADVNSGLPLSEACARHPQAFDRLYLASVRTGEKIGDLPKALAHYHEGLKHRVALRKKLSQALAYPVFLLAALGIILAVLFAFVLPRFAVMYADLGHELPLPTRLLIGVVERGYIVGPVVVAVLALVVWGWRRWTSTATGRRRAGEMMERLPYVGGLQRMAAHAQLLRSLSSLLAGGLPLVEALQTCTCALSNPVHADRLQATARLVVEGNSLARAVRRTGLLPEMAARMVEVGEASGGLDAMLAEVAQFHEGMLDARLTRMMTLVEPLLMLLMGVLIGGIIIVMYLPVFQMADIVR